MIWVDVAVKTAAVASAIIATLRAGSRAAYLLEHDGIGIMEGPTIKNTNESYPLFELSEAFRHCVRLSIAPDHYENVQQKQPVTTVIEPYPLSPKPYLPRKSHTESSGSAAVDTDEADETVVTQETEGNEALLPSFWSRQYTAFTRTISTVPSSINYTGKYLARTPQIASYWTSRLWNKKREEPEECNLEEDGKWYIKQSESRPILAARNISQQKD